MSCHQETLALSTAGRGFQEITPEVAAIVRRSGIRFGTVSVFCRHTSCSLVLMENADATARRDLETFFRRLVADGDPAYAHNTEGPDDMSAHIRMALTRSHETIPISEGRLLLGTWQGLYVWEHRTARHQRSFVVTVIGEI